MVDRHGQTEAAPVLRVEGLTKRFGALVANDGISFAVRAGEVHGLLGENGAGKSTLVKSLYGIHHTDSGRVVLNGRDVKVASPSQARDAGIGMVFQDMRLIPALTVWENIALQLRDTRRILNGRAIRAEITRASEQYGLDVEPTARVRDLSIGEWQRVELLKVLLSGPKVLILDEPTSVLTPQEVDALFTVIRRLTAEGVGVILIAHKIREVREIAERVTVLRAGRTVLEGADIHQLSDDELVRAMVGTGVGESLRRERPDGAQSDGETFASLRQVAVMRSDGKLGLDHIDLDVGRGQVLGVAGIAGNGQSELADVLVGMAALHNGVVTLAGNAMRTPDAAGFRRAGVVNIVAHPTRQFVVAGMSIAEHAALWESTRVARNKRFDVRGALRRFAERDEAAALRTAEPRRRLDQLSGGNVQRVLLTLALTETADLIVASYPTRGLDVLTTERTHQSLIKARDRGAAVVLISEDLDELLALSDHIAVLNHGRIAGVVAASTANREQLGQLMMERLS